MKNASTITLDVTLHRLADVKFLEYLKANDITFHVLTWHGPGGGNPQVEFFGTHAALKKFVYDQYTSASTWYR